MSDERLSRGYQPNWDIDLAVGKEGEQKVLDWLDSKKIEVKHDKRALDTGNVYLEYGQKRAGEDEYRDSGILTTKADYYTYVIGDVIITAPVAAWRALVRPPAGRVIENIYKREQNRGSHHSCGLIIPLDRLIKELSQ